MASVEPLRADLLPCNDKDWQLGEISVNQHVFNPNPEKNEIDQCGRSGQAAQILGRVQRHRNEHELERSFLLDEATQLHRTLCAFDSVLEQPTVENDPPVFADLAIALCCSARFILYDMYACNEKYDSYPTGQEAAMQKIAIDGLVEATERVHQLALRIRAALQQDKASVCVSSFIQPAKSWSF